MSYSVGQKLSAKQAMSLSIEEAKKGLPWVSPNPPVGCVILDKDHKLLASAYHQSFGKDHAEISALKKIKNKKLLKGAYLYVTLEPCSHKGKTPPCVNTLNKYAWNTIYYGQKDPNSKVNGKGIKKLQVKKIKIKKYNGFNKEIEDLYRVFNYNHQEKKAFVSLKVASTLDGMMALDDGSSQWISSKASRDHVSFLRACHDSVLIGVGTFLEDNPRLNIRKAGLSKKKNTVVILDPQGDCLDLLKKSQLSQVRDLSKIIVITKNIKHKKIRTICCPWKDSENQFDLESLKSLLYKEGLSSVLVEGGSNTFSSFVSQEQANVLYQFLNPSLVGGLRGLSWLESLEIENLKSKKPLKLIDSCQFEEDLLLKMIFC